MQTSIWYFLIYLFIYFTEYGQGTFCFSHSCFVNLRICSRRLPKQLFSLLSVFPWEPAAELALALHCLSRIRLPNPKAAESGMPVRLGFSAIPQGFAQVQGAFETCLWMTERCRVLVFCIICLIFFFVLVRILFSVWEHASHEIYPKTCLVDLYLVMITLVAFFVLKLTRIVVI